MQFPLPHRQRGGNLYKMEFRAAVEPDNVAGASHPKESRPSTCTFDNQVKERISDHANKDACTDIPSPAQLFEVQDPVPSYSSYALNPPFPCSSGTPSQCKEVIIFRHLEVLGGEHSLGKLLACKWVILYTVCIIERSLTD